MHVPKLEPYLSFDGNCAEAFELYEKVLGAKIEGLTKYADRMKESCPPADANKVMHGVLHLGSQVIRASDRQDVLGRRVRHGHRSLRRAVDGEL
jgi:PhnB protein